MLAIVRTLDPSWTMIWCFMLPSLQQIFSSWATEMTFSVSRLSGFFSSSAWSIALTILSLVFQQTELSKNAMICVKQLYKLHHSLNCMPGETSEAEGHWSWRWCIRNRSGIPNLDKENAQFTQTFLFTKSKRKLWWWFQPKHPYLKCVLLLLL